MLRLHNHDDRLNRLNRHLKRLALGEVSDTEGTVCHRTYCKEIPISEVLTFGGLNPAPEAGKSL